MWGEGVVGSVVQSLTLPSSVVGSHSSSDMGGCWTKA